MGNRQKGMFQIDRKLGVYVSPEAYRCIRLITIKDNISIQGYLENLIKKDLQTETYTDLLRSVAKIIVREGILIKEKNNITFEEFKKQFEKSLLIKRIENGLIKDLIAETDNIYKEKK